MCGYSCRDTTLYWSDIVHESTEKGNYAVRMLRRYFMQILMKRILALPCMNGMGIWQRRRSLWVQTQIPYIHTLKRSQPYRGVMRRQFYIRSVALRNVINGIKRFRSHLHVTYHSWISLEHSTLLPRNQGKT